MRSVRSISMHVIRMYIEFGRALIQGSHHFWTNQASQSFRVSELILEVPAKVDR